MRHQETRQEAAERLSPSVSSIPDPPSGRVAEGIYRLHAKWLGYLGGVAAVEGLAGIPFATIRGGETASLEAIIPAFGVHAAVGIFGYVLALIALGPVVVAISRMRIGQRLSHAAGVVCGTFAAQALGLALLPLGGTCGSGSGGSALTFVLGVAPCRLRTGVVWIDFAMPDPPLLLAAIFMLNAVGIRSTRPHLATILAGLFGWWGLLLVVRPLLIR